MGARSETVWWGTVIGLGSATALSVAGPLDHIRWQSSTGLFVIVTIAASLCLVAAVAVIVTAHRRDLAELGILGASLIAMSALPLVHGLTAPGVLYGPNDAVMTSAFLSLPVGLSIASPVLLRDTGVGRWTGLRWRGWVAWWIVVTGLLAATLMIAPRSMKVPPPDHPVTALIIAGCLFAGLVLSRQQLRLHQLSGRSSPLATSLALVLLTLTSLVWIGDQPFSIGWWFVHALDIAGVLIACLGALRSHRVKRPLLDVLEPILAREPLVAIELGLSPTVHRFVGDLQAKDPITRDHVVRTAELAVRLGERLGLAPSRLRNLGLAALLHDVGKLDVPDTILNKPGRLDEAEFAIVKRHPEAGAALLLRERALVPAAPVVRAHHERYDGGGYPDGLAGEAIPLEARIVAVCDAYDAMANTRQYREGMGRDRAMAILREHAGSQWDPEVVEAFVALVPGLPAQPTVLAAVGLHADCACVDALPAALISDLA